MMKKLSRLILLAGFVLLSACVSSPIKQSSSSLKAAEVRSLFSGKTVESVSRGSGLTSFTYYAPDGQLQQQRLWSRRSGKWEVLDNGKICLSFGKDRSCRRVVKEADVLGTKVTYYKVHKRKGQKAERVVRYRAFVDGNQLPGAGKGWTKRTALSP